VLATIDLRGEEVVLVPRGFGPAPFAAISHVAMIDEYIVLADGAVPELRLLGHDGSLKSIVRWSQTDLSLDDRTRRVLGDSLRAEYFGAADDHLFPPILPKIVSLVGASDGSIWVALGGRPSDVTRRWLHVTAYGKRVAVVELPASARVLDSDATHAVVLAPTEMDEERVVLIELAT